MKKYVVAILGARSAVGQCMYDIVKQRKFPVSELRLISPSGAKGTMHGLPLLALNADVFKGVDIVLSSPGAEISKIWSPVAAKAGAV
ncbi:MAG: aspartate-semialdehyde dehydrogenase, partial [Candidatus Omnitrophica bacterium]|nr:aspartate-semialdehyde dehydrogenase [Candidatus Omnitrophota bacterium]